MYLVIMCKIWLIFVAKLKQIEGKPPNSDVGKGYSPSTNLTPSIAPYSFTPEHICFSHYTSVYCLYVCYRTT